MVSNVPELVRKSLMHRGDINILDQGVVRHYVVSGGKQRYEITSSVKHKAYSVSNNK